MLWWQLRHRTGRPADKPRLVVQLFNLWTSWLACLWRRRGPDSPYAAGEDGNEVDDVHKVSPSPVPWIWTTVRRGPKMCFFVPFCMVKRVLWEVKIRHEHFDTKLGSHRARTDCKKGSDHGSRSAGHSSFPNCGRQPTEV